MNAPIPPRRRFRPHPFLAAAVFFGRLNNAPTSAQLLGPDLIVAFDADRGFITLPNEGGKLPLQQGLKRNDEGRLEFTTARQTVALDDAGMAAISAALRKVTALSIGGWFCCRRRGEQILLQRGEVEIAPLGERMFRPNERFVNFCLGTDERGFLMGAINGNGTMPFVHVTVNEVPIQTWQQLVVVKDEAGFHAFYQNGRLVHDDRRSSHAPSPQPWRETDDGRRETIRLQVPQGGLVGEAWVIGRALSPEEIAADYEEKKQRYSPAPQGSPTTLRDIHAHWSAEAPDFDRERVLHGVMQLLGPFPQEKVPLVPQVLSEEDCGGYLRRKVSIQVQPGDRMPA